MKRMRRNRPSIAYDQIAPSLTNDVDYRQPVPMTLRICIFGYSVMQGRARWVAFGSSVLGLGRRVTPPHMSVLQNSGSCRLLLLGSSFSISDASSHGGIETIECILGFVGYRDNTLLTGSRTARLYRERDSTILMIPSYVPQVDRIACGSIYHPLTHPSYSPSPSPNRQSPSSEPRNTVPLARSIRI